jgi:hypothetical protein
MKTNCTGYYLHRRGGWFRLFGYGAWCCRDHQPLFSERYGHERVYRLGRMEFKILKPNK